MNDALGNLSAAAIESGQKPALAPDLAVARRVIGAEIDGLRQLADSLGGTFVETLDLCVAATGRVIVTGIGKSGHVARKIAATLASTGTPAQFVHPAEASHGDLGMIGAGDVVIALSYSGNSAELADIVSYSRRFKIPLVALTGDRRSTLAEAADVIMQLPAAAEACSMGLTPTTSTTMMLALGDALAVALLERRGFSTENFQLYHPGGAIGRKLLRVADIMHTGAAIPLAAPHMPMSEAILLMTAKSFGCVGVCNAGGELVGVITDGDLRRHMGDALLGRTAGDVMSRNPKTIAANRLAGEALVLMTDRAPATSSLFVVDDAGRPIGFIHMHDCVRAGVA
jgi:arabinose-5-phosphate isomerase